MSKEMYTPTSSNIPTSAVKCDQTAYQMFHGSGIVTNMDKSTFQCQYYPTTLSIAQYIMSQYQYHLNPKHLVKIMRPIFKTFRLTHLMNGCHSNNHSVELSREKWTILPQNISKG